ncbi:MAG: hypothetical protein WC760_09025 [Bacteroidia bacterium]
MKNGKLLLKLFVSGLILIILSSSCAQRFWFRKKVNLEKDSTQIDKEYRIVW